MLYFQLLKNFFDAKYNLLWLKETFRLNLFLTRLKPLSAKLSSFRKKSWLWSFKILMLNQIMLDCDFHRKVMRCDVDFNLWTCLTSVWSLLSYLEISSPQEDEFLAKPCAFISLPKTPLSQTYIYTNYQISNLIHSQIQASFAIISFKFFY